MRIDDYLDVLDAIEPAQWTGAVSELVGLLVESIGPVAAIGDFCEIRTAAGTASTPV